MKPANDDPKRLDKHKIEKKKEIDYTQIHTCIFEGKRSNKIKMALENTTLNKAEKRVYKMHSLARWNETTVCFTKV